MMKTLTLTLVSVLSAGCASMPTSPIVSTDVSVDAAMTDKALTEAEGLVETNPAKALALAELVLEVRSGDPRALEVAGKSALAADELDDAVRHLSARHAAGADPEIENLLGLALWRRGTTEEAQPYLMSALAADPSRWRAAYALAEIALEQGDPSRALSLIELAQASGNGSAMLVEARGRALVAQTRHTEALAAFDQAAAMTDGRLGRGLDRRIALASTGDLVGALADANRSDAYRIHLRLAETAVRDGDKSRAVAQLKLARQASPRLDPRIDDLMVLALALDD